MSLVLAYALVVLVVISVGVHAASYSGVVLSPPPGYAVSNIDPTLQSQFRDQIYDPNFIPGFQGGVKNLSVDWKSGTGFGKIGYAVGRPENLSSGIPHLAVGPQCCNFAEVPHTQQFRMESWGDYYFVRAGLGPPGVNVENYTATFTKPAYVGLKEDRNWTIELSLNWTAPKFLAANHWGAIGLVATQYVGEAPGHLVYTEVNFWMDENSSGRLSQGTDGVFRSVSGSNLVTYHPMQLVEGGNRTVAVDLSWYLQDTLRSLGLSQGGPEPPVISYVYLNVEGYNLQWTATLWSFFVLAWTSASVPPGGWVGLASLIAASVAAVSVYAAWSMWSRATRPDVEHRSKDDAADRERK